MIKFLKITVLILLSLLILLGIIASCGESTTEKEEETPIESMNIPEEEDETNNNLSVDECIFVLEALIKSNFDNNAYHYTISQEDNIISINQWWNDVELGVSIATEKEWNEFVNSVKVANNAYQQIFLDNNHSEIIVINNIVSDKNQDYLILSVFGGEVLYDAKTGIDLYGINDISN